MKYNKFLEKEISYHKYPYLTPLLHENIKSDLGLVNIHGNVAEMTSSSNYVKGGSWASYISKSKIKDVEKWNGKSSPKVGFRIAIHLNEKIDSVMLVKIMSRIPPGTVLLNKNFGVDILEMRNIDYLTFINYVAAEYGKNSKEYKEVLPDKNVWKNHIVDGVDLSNVYFTNNKFYNHPLVGVSYEQAQLYCQWRTSYINNLYKLYHIKYTKSIGVPKRITYRLPTPQEWDMILNADSIYLPDKGMVKPEENVNHDQSAVNKRIAEGLTSSVFYFWKNEIGIYAIDDNVSEMTSEPGVAKGCNWTTGTGKNTTCHYDKPENWVGFRCVVDVEY
jgi:formylglycine-generating enzyme required for sulfatase activity